MSNEIIEHRYWMSKQIQLCKPYQSAHIIRAFRDAENEKIIPYLRLSNVMRELKISTIKALSIS